MMTIEKRLKLLGDVSNLMLMGSIQVYVAQKPRVHMQLNNASAKSSKAA